MSKQQHPNRQRALEAYYLNPNYCLNCGHLIVVRDNEKVRFAAQRRYCNTSCATAHMNTIRGQQALDAYNLNPNQCLNCGEAIQVKPGHILSEVRTQKFCSQSCACSYSNKHRPSRSSGQGVCQNCSSPVTLKPKKGGGYYARRYCDNCVTIKRLETRAGVPIADQTKGDLFKNRSTWQSARSSIRRHAQAVYLQSDKPKHCIVCGYDHHFEVCHIDDVSSFPKTALVREINAITNLIALCPNHHWEFDNHLLVFTPEGAT